MTSEPRELDVTVPVRIAGLSPLFHQYYVIYDVLTLVPHPRKAKHFVLRYGYVGLKADEEQYIL